MNNQLSMADLLLYLNDEIRKAQAEKDDDSLNYLGTAVDVILQAAYEKQDKNVGGILEDLAANVNDVGVEWKSKFYSEEKIRQLLAENC
jgi:hypothetical protein